MFSELIGKLPIITVGTSIKRVLHSICNYYRYYLRMYVTL